MSSSQTSTDTKVRQRTMSASVHRLQEALNMHLDVQQKSDFVSILNQFHMTRDTAVFVINLKELLDTPAKKQMVPLIRKVIPKVDLDDFDHCIKHGQRKFDTMPAKRSKKPIQRSRPPLSVSGLSRILPLKPKKKQKEKVKKKSNGEGGESDTSNSRNTSTTVRSSSERSAVRSSSERSSRSLKSVTEKGNEVKNIFLKAADSPEKGFGFSIRGGAEFGIGIYISKLDEDGMAETHGLMAGDLIMEVNDVPFDKITHTESAMIIRSATQLDMKICRVGRIPGTFVVHQMYKWVNSKGRPVSPPPELEHIGQLGSHDSVSRKSGFMLLKGADERKINVTVKPGQSLGLMVRGGREFGLGIYISGVDSLSMADNAGIKVGDQLLDVNGQSFLDITHAEAVRILKTSKQLFFTIKDVGKLPYGRTKIDQTNWLNQNTLKSRHRRRNSQTSDSTSGTQTSSSGAAFRRGIGSQLMLNTAISSKWDTIEHQADQLLNETEQGTLRYYLSEYQNGFITVDGLAMASFELLNTRAKMTLISPIRDWVRPQDLDKFDVLLHRREALHGEGLLPEDFSTYSLDRVRVHVAKPFNQRSPGWTATTSAPVSRSATVRERPTKTRKRVSDWELEPLRLAIEQIEDNPQFLSGYLQQDNLRSSKHQSVSMEQLGGAPNLLKSSLSSRRSLSTDTLTPVYIDTTSDLPPSPRQQTAKATSNEHRSRRSSLGQRSNTTSLGHRSYSAFSVFQGNDNKSPQKMKAESNQHAGPRLRSHSTSQSQRSGNSYSHRQRSSSVSSSVNSRQRSTDDLRMSTPRPQSNFSTPYPSRRQSYSSDTNVKDLATAFNSYHDNRDVRTTFDPNNVIYAEVHHQPRHQTEVINSDDSGVEVNGNHANDNRVTISADNPVDISDALQRRSSLVSVPLDNQQSNHSTLTNQSRISLLSTTHHHHSSNHSIVTDVSNQNPPSNQSTIVSQRSSGRKSLFGQTVAGERQQRLHPWHGGPPEIRINDGEGSIDTLSMDTPASPHFVTSNGSVLHHPSALTQSSLYSNEAEDSDDELDEPDMYDFQSEVGNDSDLFVSPLDRVLDAEDSYSDVEARQIEEARLRYGDIPLLIIPVYKTKPTLGMAIEGGANTRQPLPRVINLQPGGSAYESGGLKVGHVILEVNQSSLVGLEHLQAAKTIAEAFKNKSHDNMELLVTESDVLLKNYS